ncbi:MAG: hypothetical protein QM619_04640 [Micropruina sp.]
MTVALGVDAALTGCAKTPPVPVPTPGAPSVSETASESASPSGSSTTATTGTPSTSETPSLAPVAKATGSLTLYSEASTKLAGTCRTASGAPTLAVADRSNEFFGTIDVTLVLNARKNAVTRLTIALGEDSDQVTRTLAYRAEPQAEGTSAKLTGSGSGFAVTGMLANTENGKASGPVPVTLKITCAGEW